MSHIKLHVRSKEEIEVNRCKAYKYLTIENMIEKAKNYGMGCHEKTNHRYDNKPYSFHLQMVFDTAMRYAHIIPEKDRENVLAACWVHDVIEDCRQTYNDVKAATNEVVAELAYALTNEKGKTRKERANANYYYGIRQVQYASFVKVCDRIANVSHAITTKSRLAEVYKKEYPDFEDQLWSPEVSTLFIELKSLLAKV